MIWDATLNQTNSTANNNKFYRIQILTTPDAKNYVTWTRWGRVGENGQSASLGDGTLDGAKKWFEKKFKDKSGLAWVNRLSTPRSNKYTFLERNYEEDDEEVEKEEKKTVKKETLASDDDDESTTPGHLRILYKLMPSQISTRLYPLARLAEF